MVCSPRSYCSTWQACHIVARDVARVVAAVILVSALAAGRPMGNAPAEETTLVAAKATPALKVLCRGQVSVVSIKLRGKGSILTEFFLFVV